MSSSLIFTTATFSCRQNTNISPWAQTFEDDTAYSPRQEWPEMDFETTGAETNEYAVKIYIGNITGSDYHVDPYYVDKVFLNQLCLTSTYVRRSLHMLDIKRKDRNNLTAEDKNTINTQQPLLWSN